MEVISRKEARDRGLQEYFTGKPCVRSHLAFRLLSTGICKDCNRENSARYRAKNPEKARKYVANAWKKNRAKYRKGHTKATTAWKRRNPEKVKQIGINWRAKVGLGYGRAARAKRRATEKRQLPSWADIGAIKQIYAKCPPGHHVDHVIPLRGKFVSGLHVETNLQYLPASENQRKHNQFNPEVFS